MRHALAVSALALALAPVVGCVQGDMYSSGAVGSGTGGGVASTGCGYHCRAPTVAASSSSSTSGSASSTTGGSGSGLTTATGTTGGSTTGSPAFPCAEMSAPLAGGSCQTGSLAISGRTLDLYASSTLKDGGVVPLTKVAVGAFGCPMSPVTTADGGRFTLCVPANAPITPLFSLHGYVTLELAELDPTVDVSLQGTAGGGGIFMISTLVQSFLGTSVSINPAAGAAIALVQSLSGTGACAPLDGGLPDYAGWVVKAQYLDGTAGPWPVGYLGGQAIDPSATSTSAAGVALIYNITDATEIKVTASRVSPDPANLSAACPLQNSALGFTGNVQTPPTGDFGYFPIMLP